MDLYLKRTTTVLKCESNCLIIVPYNKFLFGVNTSKQQWDLVLIHVLACVLIWCGIYYHHSGFIENRQVLQVA